VVAEEAAEDSCSNSMEPEPEKVYEEVSSSDWSGRRKIRLQVEPVYVDGMSKLKIVDSFDEMVPKYWVPYAVSGEVDDTGMMRCGY
jgi:hypothetical protein